MCFESAHLVVVMNAPFHVWSFDEAVRVEIGGMMGLSASLRPLATISHSFVSFSVCLTQASLLVCLHVFSFV